MGGMEKENGDGARHDQEVKEDVFVIILSIFAPIALFGDSKDLKFTR